MEKYLKIEISNPAEEGRTLDADRNGRAKILYMHKIKNKETVEATNNKHSGGVKRKEKKSAQRNHGSPKTKKGFKDAK